MSVEPVEQSVPPGRVAGALARFRDRHGYLRDGRRRVDVPAADAAAGVEVVDVPGGHEVVQGIGGLVRHPAREVVGVADPAQGDDVGRAGGAHRVQQGLHPGNLEGHARAGAAVTPAGPRGDAVGLVVRPGLVEELEDHRVVALERARDARPEGRRVILIGHGHLVRRERGPRGAPVQVQERVQPVLVEQVHIARDRAAVARARVRRRDAVDPQPALLVERHSHHVGVPALDRSHRGLIHRTITEAPTLHARVLHTGAVHATQDHRLAESVHQAVALNVDRSQRARRDRRGCRRRRDARRRRRRDAWRGCRRDARGHRKRRRAAVPAQGLSPAG